VTVLYLFHFVFLLALLALIGALVALARVHDRE
jgi:hypothetical protein